MANWIKGAVKRPGQLHKDLGVPAGKKIPAAKEEAVEAKAARMRKQGKKLSPNLRKIVQRINFAHTMSSFGH